MTVFDNRTTKMDQRKIKIKHYLRPQLDVYNKKIITKSNSRHIKSKQNSLTYASLEKLWDRFSMQLLNRSTKKPKIAKRCKVKKYVSIFENN